MPHRPPKQERSPERQSDPVAADTMWCHEWVGYYDEPLSFSWSRPMGEWASGVLLSAIDLAERRDFRIGDAEISPSTRVIRGAGGETAVEPRVMQVLLALADARGRVVSREALFRQCWGNVTVGEDSLNRIIAEARRVMKAVAPESLAIETIPRTGYRLVACKGEWTGLSSGSGESATELSDDEVRPTRRHMFIGAAAGAGVLALGWAGWRLTENANRLDPRVEALIAQSEQAIRTNLPDSDAQGVGFLEEAVALQPGHALPWGRLALARSIVAEHAAPDRTMIAVQGTQDAARRALALDSKQPDALSALAILPPYYGAWWAAEQRMQGVLAVEPEHLPTRDHLCFMHVAVGRAREGSTDRLEIAAREPLHAGFQFKLVYSHWILGQIGEADRAADRALQLWPKHPGVWLSRLWTLAFTGRPERALAHLEDAQGRPDFPLPMLQGLRLAMLALATRRPADVEGAAAAALDLITQGPGHSIAAVMILNAMGQTDRAFDVAEAYLLERGPLMASVRWRAGQVSINDQRRRKTNMLFVPVSAPMWPDRRFRSLVQEIGLSDYWDRARVTPDFLR